jgi:Alternative oxidase
MVRAHGGAVSIVVNGREVFGRRMMNGAFAAKHGVTAPELHHEPQDLSDRFALFITQCLRFGADLFFAKRYGHRAVVLETVAAVPGMVGATITHLHCLRRMVDDDGWIRTLMDEAENERMHLMPAADEKRVSSGDGDEFDRPLGVVVKAIVGGGVSLPWNLALAGLIGLSLLFTRVTLGAEGSLADAHHIIGCAVLTVVAIAAADVARPARALNALLGVGLMFAPLLLDADKLQFAVTLGLGIALVLLSVRRGPILERYGAWNRLLV